MAYIDGVTVSEKIRERPLKIGEALDIAIQAARDCGRRTPNGIVHRDIKSANIMVTREGQVKIMDFGLAHLADRTRLDPHGKRLGTPAYMSPEQAQAQPVDRRSDIWSLGVVLYAMATGASRSKAIARRRCSIRSCIVRMSRSQRSAWACRRSWTGSSARRWQRTGRAVPACGRPDCRFVGAEEADGIGRIGAGSGTGATNARGWTKYAMYGALAVVTAYAAWVSIVHFGERPERIAAAAAPVLVHTGLAGHSGQSSGRDLAGRQAHRLYERGFGRRDLDSRYGPRAAAATGGDRECPRALLVSG